jgi:acid stress chaperone HdeB
MEGTVKGRLLLTSALFLFAQIPTMQAQVTVDVAKITCEQFLDEKLPGATTRDVLLWLRGYYNGKRNNTIIEPLTFQKDEEKLNSYCYQHSETTVMDAIKNVPDFGK